MSKGRKILRGFSMTPSVGFAGVFCMGQPAETSVTFPRQTESQPAPQEHPAFGLAHGPPIRYSPSANSHLPDPHMPLAKVAHYQAYAAASLANAEEAVDILLFAVRKAMTCISGPSQVARAANVKSSPRHSWKS
jgi:hypothetical protein